MNWLLLNVVNLEYMLNLGLVQKTLVTLFKIFFFFFFFLL
jgi:hypothetical protein